MIWPRLSVEQCASRPVVRLSGVLPPVAVKYQSLSSPGLHVEASFWGAGIGKAGRERGLLEQAEFWRASHTQLFSENPLPAILPLRLRGICLASIKGEECGPHAPTSANIAVCYLYRTVNCLKSNSLIRLGDWCNPGQSKSCVQES